jgi:hypothetical protein
MYFLVVAARNGAQPVAAGSAISLIPIAATELLRLDGQAAEVMRLDRLLGERDTALDRQTAHIHHLEDIATHREKLVIERDAQLRR